MSVKGIEFNKNRKTFCGTMEYMAPEIIKRQSYGHKVDIWSMGVLLYEMLHGYAPFTGQNDPDIVFKIVENEIVYEDYIKDDAKKLINSMLINDPDLRPEMWEVFASTWMQRMLKEVPGVNIIKEMEPKELEGNTKINLAFEEIPRDLLYSYPGTDKETNDVPIPQIDLNIKPVIVEMLILL